MDGTASFRLILRTGLLAPLFLLALPVHALVARWRPDLAARLTVPFHRSVCRILGIRRRVIGTLPDQGAALIVSNHVSWLDIVVLGALTPLSFVAKSEVGTWPGVKVLARAQRTIFVDRRNRLATGSAAGMVAARLAAGDRIVLFAEGTTSDGNRVLPYRSALIGAVSGGGTPIRPIAISYTHLAGLPLTRRERPRIAWYGDMDLLPHLKALVAGPAIDVTVHVGPELAASTASDRKRIAAEAEVFARAAITGRGNPQASCSEI